MIRKAPGRNLYWVQKADGSHMSHAPLPLETAKKQLIALNIAMKKEMK